MKRMQVAKTFPIMTMSQVCSKRKVKTWETWSKLQKSNHEHEMWVIKPTKVLGEHEVAFNRVLSGIREKLHDIWRLNEVNSNFELNFLVLSKIIWGQAILIWSLKSKKSNASNGMQIEIETKKVIVKWDQVEKWVWLHVKIVDQANSTIILVEIISTWHIIKETCNSPCQKILTKASSNSTSTTIP